MFFYNNIIPNTPEFNSYEYATSFIADLKLKPDIYSGH